MKDLEYIGGFVENGVDKDNLADIDINLIFISQVFSSHPYLQIGFIDWQLEGIDQECNQSHYSN